MRITKRIGLGLACWIVMLGACDVARAQTPGAGGAASTFAAPNDWLVAFPAHRVIGTGSILRFLGILLWRGRLGASGRASRGAFGC